MSRSFGRFFGKMKRLLDTSAWFSFSFYLFTGFIIAILLSQSFYKVFAKPNLKLDRFDPDIYPVIDVSHLPPLIARSHEKVKLEFDFACGYVIETGSCCKPNATLFVSYGERKDFMPIALTEENHDSLRVLSVNIPASDDKDQPLRYYLKVNDPEFGLDVRYPIEGTFKLFVVPDLTPIGLPVQELVEVGDLVLALSWGSSPDQVGFLDVEGYPQRLGPSAIDVADDGRIAILDHVNRRVLIYDPTNQSFSNIPLPFPHKTREDIQFDRDGQIAVFDRVGERLGQSSAPVPQLYRLLPDGRVRTVAPVFAKTPSWLTKELKIVDLAYSELITPIDSSGEVNSREVQRQNKITSELLVKSVAESVKEFQLADTKDRIAFEVRSVSPLGAISLFERIPLGYVAVFETDLFRAIWFDSAGNVVQDVTLQNNDRYSEINPYGQVAIDQLGSVYILVSTEKGIEVRYIKSP